MGLNRRIGFVETPNDGGEGLRQFSHNQNGTLHEWLIRHGVQVPLMRLFISEWMGWSSWCCTWTKYS